MPQFPPRVAFLEEGARSLQYNYWQNWTTYNDSDSNGSYSSDNFDEVYLKKAQDVSVDAVVASLYFNSIVFCICMILYEILRRRMPAVYSSRKKLYMSGSKRRQEQPGVPQDEDDMDSLKSPSSSESSLPEIDKPLDWILPVFGVSWRKVRQTAGLDGYFFLRYIRMNVRICAVSTVWFFLILVPVYYTGDQNAYGWYRFSAANVPHSGFRMWLPCIFLYLFTGFIFFVIKQEYRHFLEIRQDFLARGTSYINPQHHYSLKIEMVPYELRSSVALYEYFDNLFPGKVHSASIVLKLPDLEVASRKCMRSCRRLEKSIAYYHATGQRPVHTVGRKRLSVLGIDLLPVECGCCVTESASNVGDFYALDDYDDDDGTILPESMKPPRGTRVDSIQYYTQELAVHSRNLYSRQQAKSRVAESGNESLRASNWMDKIVKETNDFANRILNDSQRDNALATTPTGRSRKNGIPQAETMTSQYGSIGTAFWRTIDTGDDELVVSPSLARRDALDDEYVAPFSRDQYTGLRRFASRLGLDCVVAGFQVLHKQVDMALQGVVYATMSSTGFVTFLDLATTTCAASAPLTVKTSVLHVNVAPEPREIIWENAAVPETLLLRRERIANTMLSLGAILWSFPLAAIQAFAKAEFLAQIPGMEWILEMHGGKMTGFVNGYLPVVALLGLILILPVLFEYIAVKYERRKTFSDVQTSMMIRYYFYQLATIYISVTAGSILKSLADILDRPSLIFQLLGKSLPTMAGYFIALLVTKTLAGLPMVFLRFGALSRMLFLRMITSQAKMTQRELDAMYRLENVQYGWEFPSQHLVVVIVFTYAIMCPVILPFGLMYFAGALMVYKKQILYVYSPVYESGGAMFPLAVQRTILGLVCAQMTFLGYTLIRGCYYQPIFLFPLPLITWYGMSMLHETYAKPSQRLSLERGRECDRLSSLDEKMKQAGVSVSSGDLDHGVEARRNRFNKSSYRQPVLTRLSDEPWTYRRGLPDDPETLQVRAQLRQINRDQRIQRDVEAAPDPLAAPTSFS